MIQISLYWVYKTKENEFITLNRHLYGHGHLVTHNIQDMKSAKVSLIDKCVKTI